MKLTAKQDFYDVKEQVTRIAGDILDVSDERGEVLLAAGVAERAADEPAAEKPAKKQTRKTAKK